MKFIPIICYALLILYLSLKPSGPAFIDIQHLDKLQHFIAYSAFAVVALTLRLGTRGYILICISIVIFSGLIELVQPTFGRECSIYDLIANSCGVLLGHCISNQLNNRLPNLLVKLHN